MIKFDNGIDGRSRDFNVPTVARFGDRFCVVGTEYGHIHTTSGDVKTWGSYSGAYRAMKNYRSF